MTEDQRYCFVNTLRYIGFQYANMEYGLGLQYNLITEKGKYELIVKCNIADDLYYSYMKYHSGGLAMSGWLPMDEEKIREYFKDVIRENKLKSLVDE